AFAACSLAAGPAVARNRLFLTTCSRDVVRSSVNMNSHTAPTPGEATGPARSLASLRARRAEGSHEDAYSRAAPTRVQGHRSPSQSGSCSMSATVTDRLLRYVVIDTQSVAASATQPSTAKQRILGRLLVDELFAIGVADAHLDEHGYV